MNRPLLVVAALAGAVAVVVAVPTTSSAQWREPASTTPAEVLAIVEDAGTLARANRDLYANAFIASNLTADGGVGTYSFMSNTDSCAKLGAGSQSTICASSNTLSFAGTTSQQTAYIVQPACGVNQTCRWFADTGYFFGLFPTTDTTGCAAGNAGGLRYVSTDNTFRGCNGTSLLKLAYVLTSAETSLDFGNLASHDSETLTITLTGATTSDVVICRPTGGTGLTANIDIHEYVSAADTISLTAHNDSGGNVDPAATTFKCQIVR